MPITNWYISEIQYKYNPRRLGKIGKNIGVIGVCLFEMVFVSMANLNKVMGMAHVEAEIDCEVWSGYINLAAYPAMRRQFDVEGVIANWFYEGPVRISDQYYMARGSVLVKNIAFDPSPSVLRVDFVGNGKLELLWQLSETPFDFLK